MITYTDTYSITDGLALLAIDRDLEERILDAMDDNSTEIGWEIEQAITAKIQEHGVTDQGEWLGEWSAADVVTAVLDAHGA